MKFKNLMFDLGGVIMDIRRENAVRALMEIGLKDADSLLGVYGQKGAFLALEKGLITPAEFRTELRKMIGNNNVTDKQIDAAFCKFLIGIPESKLHELEAFRAQGHRIFLLSNTNALMWDEFILPEFTKLGKDINHYFDGLVTSFEAHAYKPDPDIFRRVIDTCHIAPGETLFFDDSAENCEASRKMGFHAVHVDDVSLPLTHYLQLAQK